ncbi:MAG: stage III sporulation protein AB [Clostridia bacterium]|nr:stage III sporulation protein AB [Clostridia bacterium]
MSIFKILGLIFLLLSSTFFGFYKGNFLVKRYKSLEKICFALERLGELIKNGTGDLGKLMSFCFGDLVETTDGIKLNCSTLLKEDAEFFYEFLGEIGISDRESEYKRILIYKTLFEKRRGEAEKNAEKLCKLYNSCGFLVGLSLCIFLV